MKKILFLNGGGTGGAETMTVLYAKILHDVGFQTIVFTKCSDVDKGYSVSMIPDTIEHIEVVCKFRELFIYIPYLIWKYHPDLVFCWDFHIVKYILTPIRQLHLCPTFKLVCRCPNTPSIMDPAEKKGLYAFKSADVVISQTKEMSSELVNIVGIPSERVITIYNPIFKEKIHKDILCQHEFDSKFVNYVAAGRIAEQKDYPTMLEAFALVLKRQPNSRLYILGQANEQIMPILYNIVRCSNMEDKVYFEGYQDNPHKYEINADAFVISSTYEGLPNAMIEAMYLGVPVAATECIPYITQVISSGVNGYTCPIKDSNKLAEAMILSAKIKGLPRFVDINNSELLIVKTFETL